ncbi:MAG: hypothetical protein II271_03050, partial [Muribaculaceae bacterium]|nr:hypothetical protein [Muribaculaceae bacterium]
LYLNDKVQKAAKQPPSQQQHCRHYLYDKGSKGGDSLPSYLCSPLLFPLSDNSSSSAVTETHETFMHIGRGVGHMGLTPLIVDISR